MNTRKVPLRKCTGCSEMKEKKEMLRLILTPEGNIEIDKTGKKNGRGAYICKNTDCLKKAVKGKCFERSLKTAIPVEVYERLEKELITIEGE